MFHVRPSVEPVVAGEMAFITKDPLILMDEGNFHNVPFLTGVTLSEGLFQYAVGVLNSDRTLQEIDQDFTKTFKPELRVCRDESCGDAMIPKIRSFYFGNQHLNNNNVQNFVDMCTDMNFADGALHGVKTMSSLNSAPVYFYQFSYDGGLVDPLPDLANFSRPTHGDDMGYIFDKGIQVSDESLDAKVRSRMVTMWTNFAKTGNPTPQVTEEIPAWLPYTDKETNYLDIGAQLELKKDYHKRRMDFLDELYSLK
ncbi:esterase E4-like [Anabrus simplex]|uniref:esterase E4-like n=1 Tax=Anabrus simplex TaxID=316456 RepID=UPI0035A31C9D